MQRSLPRASGSGAGWQANGNAPNGSKLLHPLLSAQQPSRRAGAGISSLGAITVSGGEGGISPQHGHPSPLHPGLAEGHLLQRCPLGMWSSAALQLYCYTGTRLGALQDPYPSSIVLNHLSSTSCRITSLRDTEAQPPGVPGPASQLPAPPSAI